jgi:hypothetical protein
LRTPLEHNPQSGFGIGLGQNLYGLLLQRSFDEVKAALVVIDGGHGHERRFHTP